MNQANLSNLFLNLSFFSYLNNIFLLLSDANQSTVNSEFNKLTRSQKLQIAYGNEKLDTILSQVNTSEILRLAIGNTQNDIMPLASIITERLDNIQKD